MNAFVLAVALAQAPSCADTVKEEVRSATELVALFDVGGAVARLARASDCSDAEIARWYLRGLLAARDAYRYGGSPESLVPVAQAIAVLSTGVGESPSAEIARVMLQAASAAAQSEREEMGLLLEHAVQLEARQRAVGATPALVLGVQEVVGDLWLQVHRFEDARRAYEQAARETGRTRRVELGLARVAARVNDEASACAGYRSLVAGWPASAREPAEMAEGRAFLKRPACRVASRPGRRR